MSESIVSESHAAITRAAITGMIESQLRSDAEMIVAWKVRFEIDPLAAFEWSEKTIAAAARSKIYREWHEYLAGGGNIADMMNMLNNAVLSDAASGVKKSTSMVANLTDSSTKQARAALYHMLVKNFVR